MRKLNKVNSGRLDTIEAYSCVCACGCSGACSGCGCALVKQEASTNSSLSTGQTTTAKSRGSSNGYRK
jgi:putative bacteriocin precursor